MLSVLCYPKSIAVRRCIYKTYVAYCIIVLIVFIIVIILILTVDSLTEDVASNSYSSSNDYYYSARRLQSSYWDTDYDNYWESYNYDWES